MRKITLYPAPDHPYGPSEITIWSRQDPYPALIDALAIDLNMRADDLHGMDIFRGETTAEIIYARAPNDGHHEIIGSIDRQLTADEWREVRRVFPREFARAA